MCQISPDQVNVLLVSIWKLFIPAVFLGFVFGIFINRTSSFFEWCLDRSAWYRGFRYRSWLRVHEARLARNEVIDKRIRNKALEKSL
jgi:hypothetical protein